MPTKDELLAGFPQPLPLTSDDVVRERAAIEHQLVVLDDHPSGSQTIAGVPVLYAWSEEDIAWALGTGADAAYIVTGSRALSPAAAENRYLEITNAVLEVARRTRRPVEMVLRADSSLRGHFPLDVDILANAVDNFTGAELDGIIIVPAFPEAGRITVRSVHHVSDGAGSFLPIGETRFGRDPRFPYSSSDLREWVAERTRGRHPVSSVIAITLDVVRTSPDAVAGQLMRARRGTPIVVDAVTEEDLRSIAIGAMRATAAGARFAYRVGSPFVRAMLGQPVHEPLTADEIETMRQQAGATRAQTGLVFVGAPLPLTRRQVRVLAQRRNLREVPLSVPALLDQRRDAHIDQVVNEAVAGLELGSVVVRLADMPVETEARGDFSIDPRIAQAVNDAVYRISRRARLKFVVARGGSIISPVAQGLGVRRVMARGSLLDNVVALWQPVSGRMAGTPFAVHAGGVGDDEALADVVDKLSGISPAPRPAPAPEPLAAPQPAISVAVIGLGWTGLPLALRLAQRFRVAAWDIDEVRRTMAEGHHLAVAASLAAAVSGATTVLLAVRGLEGLEEVLFGQDGIADRLRPGSVVVVTMAVGRDEVRDVAARLASRSVHLLDAPLSGGSVRAGQGELVVLAGGRASTLAAVSPVLEHVASTIIHVGEEVGDGQAMKAVNQLLAAVNLAAVSEALTLASTLGLDPALALHAAASSTAYSFMASDRGPRMAEALGGVTPAMVNRLDLTAAELGVAIEMARDAGLPTPVAAAVEQLFLRAQRDLGGDVDDAEIVRLAEPDGR